MKRFHHIHHHSRCKHNAIRSKSSSFLLSFLLLVILLQQHDSVFTLFCDAAAAAAAAAAGSISTKRSSSSSVIVPQNASLPTFQQQQQQEAILEQASNLESINPLLTNQSQTITTTTTTSPSSSPSQHTTTTIIKKPKTNTKKYMITLSYLSGVSDIIAHLKYDCYASMMTGNAINCMTSFMSRDIIRMTKLGMMITCYMIGVAFFKIVHCSVLDSIVAPPPEEEEEVVVEEDVDTRGMIMAKRKGTRQMVSTVLILFLLSDMMDTLFDYVTIHDDSSLTCTIVSFLQPARAPLLASAHGIINAASTTCITAGTICFALTGHITKIGQFMADYYLFWRKKKKQQQRRAIIQKQKQRGGGGGGYTKETKASTQKKYVVNQATKTSLTVMMSFICGIGSAALGEIVIHQQTSSSSSMITYSRVVLEMLQSIPPFFIIGVFYAMVLHFGMNGYYEEQILKLSSSSKQEGVQDVNYVDTTSNSGGGSSGGGKSKKKRRRRSSSSTDRDSRMDGWTNVPKGPKPFRDG